MYLHSNLSVESFAHINRKDETYMKCNFEINAYVCMKILQYCGMY